MNKYIAFAFYGEYPSGGLGDIIGDFDTFEEAKQRVNDSEYEYSYIVDRDTWEKVWECEG